MPLVRKRRRRKSTRHALRRAPWGAGRVARPRRPRTASTRPSASWTSLRPVDRHARALAARTRVRTRRRQLIRVRRDVPSAPPATTARSGGAAWTVGLPATFRRRARSDGAARSPRRTRWRPRRRRRCCGRRVSPSPPVKATTEMHNSRNETNETSRTSRFRRRLCRRRRLRPRRRSLRLATRRVVPGRSRSNRTP